MEKKIKFLLVALAAIFTLIGSAFATPINVVDVNVEKTNGNYVVLTELNNVNPSAGKYTGLSFSIEELGTSKSVGVVEVATNQTEVFEYSLSEITDNLENLKKGNTYQITVSTEDGSSMSDTFLFGEIKETEGLSLIIDEVSVNNDVITDLNNIQIMNGQILEIKIKFTALENIEDARLMTFLEGYEHSPLVDSTEVFSVKSGITYTKSMQIVLPSDMNSEKMYKLRITGANDLSGLTYKDYSLYVDTQRDRVDVLDLVMTPSSGVEPGQNIIANVRMKNRGQQTQDSVKVSVAIPQLGVSESSYVSNLNENEVLTSDDMLLFVPEDAQAQQYDVEVTLTYNDGYTQSMETFTLNVIAPQTAPQKSLIVSLNENVNLKAEEATTFEIVVANENEESKPISIATLDSSWANVEISPSLAMVQGGSSETFKVTLTPKTGVEGDRELTLAINEAGNLVKEVTVSTYVEPDQGIDWLNFALIVLLIIAIIILIAIVIAIAKRKNEGDEEFSSTEEYY